MEKFEEIFKYEQSSLEIFFLVEFGLVVGEGKEEGEEK